MEIEHENVSDLVRRRTTTRIPAARRPMREFVATTARVPELRIKIRQRRQITLQVIELPRNQMDNIAFPLHFLPWISIIDAPSTTRQRRANSYRGHSLRRRRRQSDARSDPDEGMTKDAREVSPRHPRLFWTQFLRNKSNPDQTVSFAIQ